MFVCVYGVIFISLSVCFLKVFCKSFTPQRTPESCLMWVHSIPTTYPPLALTAVPTISDGSLFWLHLPGRKKSHCHRQNVVFILTITASAIHQFTLVTNRPSDGRTDGMPGKIIFINSISQPLKSSTHLNL